MIYGKYEFIKVPDLSEVDGAVVELGYLLETKGAYDEDGEVITAPIISDKLAVDILWNNEADETLESNRIYPITPSHSIAGMEELYFKTL